MKRGGRLQIALWSIFVWIIGYLSGTELLGSIKREAASVFTSNSTTVTTSSVSAATIDNAILPFPSVWLDQIKNDLKPFSTSRIQRDQLDYLCDKHKGLVRILIHDNNLYLHESCRQKDSREPFGIPHAVIYMMMRMLCLYRMPNMELVLNYGDGAVVQENKHPLAAVFSWCKSNIYNDILMPYWSSVWLPWAEDVKASPQKVLTNETWQQKKDLAFWRGSATGGIFTMQNWRNLTRGILVQKCHSRPDLCDAIMTKCSQCDPDVAAEIERLGLSVKERTPPDKVFEYKYVIVVDGNGPPSSRARYTFMQGSSLVLFAETEQYEFFYSSLRPHIHYLPISQDLEDLYGKIEWARQHQDESKKMVLRVQQFVRDYMTADTVTAYMHTLFTEYANFLDFIPQITPEFAKGIVFLAPQQTINFGNYMRGGQSGEEGRCKHWKNRPQPINTTLIV